MPEKLSHQLLHFYQHLQPPGKLPAGINFLYPQQNPEVMKVVQQFLSRFYADNHSRHLILGINPGRLGAGITGVNFTAPRQLKKDCGIDHALGNSSELSAEFIYEVIEQYGGTDAFYSHWFIGAVCPLGFVKEGKNMNYYDDTKLAAAVTSFIIKTIQQQVSFNFKRDYCICIGGEKNYTFLDALNKKYHWFEKIIPLPHPRFIMQYKQREKENYIQLYLSTLRNSH